MKLAFSTLGCPDFSWSDIYSMAKDFGFDGIEMRGLGNDIFSVRAQPFRPDQLDKTIANLKRLRLEIPCLSTGCVLKDAYNWNETKEEIKEYIRLAEKLGTPYIRLLGDRNADAEGPVDDDVVLRALREIVPYAEKHHVILLVETNGVYSDTNRLRDLLVRVESDNVAALWDMHHSYRFAGESPETTIQNLGVYIKHIYIKDSKMVDGKVKYKIMGEGDMPIESMIRALRSVNYEGYISLEWVKNTAPELQAAVSCSRILLTTWSSSWAATVPATACRTTPVKPASMSGPRISSST